MRKEKAPMPDLIILLPGILGSVLKKNGKDVWALSAGAIARGAWTLGGSVEDLELTHDPPDVDDLGDGITATGLMPDTHLIPGLWKIDGYSKISCTILSKFQVKPGENYFEFPYDWRRDNRVAARRLAHLSKQWLETWRKKSGNQMAKLILVGHSMGGLVSRYFLEVLEGWEYTRSLVTFGTPYRGSLKALNFIANGFKKGLGPLALDLSNLSRSLTSLYQLLPIYECYDPGDGEYRRVGQSAGIPNVDAARAAEALHFHEEIRSRVDGHLGDNAYKNDGYLTYPIVGTHQPTLQSSRLEGVAVRVFTDYKGNDQGGDGTVPRVSATPIELSHAHREMFAAAQHASLQNDDAVLVQLEEVLKGNQVDLDLFKAMSEEEKTKVKLGLEIDDAYGYGEPIQVRVRPDKEVKTLIATISDIDSQKQLARRSMAPKDGRMETEAFQLDSGAYRVTVSGDEWVNAVTDVFVVE